MTRIAVSIHDVEPATYDRCALMRDWLDDLGIDRVTLLVVPASDMHPFPDRSPGLASWLSERVSRGDCVAQHGLRGRRTEFDGLDEDDTRRAVLAGRRVLHLAGVEPRGFVAPANAYSEALSLALAGSFDWWASFQRVWSDHGQRVARIPAIGFGRVLPPLVLRASAARAGELLRLDLRPADIDRPGHVAAVESVLLRASARTPVTYDEL